MGCQEFCTVLYFHKVASEHEGSCSIISCLLLIVAQTESSMNAPPKPQRRLTAQEMCYQRMQIAQQQAAQLTASAAKNASPVPRPLSSAAGAGEKRRLMHRPNPALVSAKKPGTLKFLLKTNEMHHLSHNKGEISMFYAL